MRLARYIGLAVAAVTVVGLLAACGDDEPSTGNGTTATATEAAGEESPVTSDAFFVEIAAENTEYDVSELGPVPAGEPILLQFDNDDPEIQHNWSLYETEESTDPIFEGEILTGVDTIDYSIDPLDAGTYHFHCDIHPTQMQGELIVE